jgi:hypothetical protein
MYTTCPTYICLENHQKPPPKSITCPESGSPCKLNNGRVVKSGYIEYCDTPLCGTWEKENKCATMHCLNIGENDPEKPKCIGTADQGCINDQGILVTAGTTEMCQLPACTELTIDEVCAGQCQTGNGYPIEEFSCNGARCKNATSKLWQNETGGETMPPRPCSKLTDWAWEKPGSKKTCLNEKDEQPKLTRTCKKINLNLKK